MINCDSVNKLYNVTSTEITCKNCSKKFKNKLDVINHYFLCHKEVFINCSVCKKLILLADIKNHMLSHFENQLQQKVKCKKCDFFGICNEFICHLTTDHDIKEKNITKVTFERFAYVQSNIGIIALMYEKINIRK